MVSTSIMPSSSPSASIIDFHPPPSHKHHNRRHNNASSNHKLLSFCIFVLIGSSVCIAFNEIVNSINSIHSIYFPSIDSFSEPIIASYNVSVLIGAVILLKIGSDQCSTLLTGLIGTSLCSFLFVYLCCFMPDDSSFAPVILSIASSLLGFLVSAGLASAFAFSSHSPLLSAGVSTGMGLGALISFGTWLFLSRVAFPLDTKAQPSTITLQFALMSLIGVQGVIALLAVLGALILDSKQQLNSSKDSSSAAIPDDGVECCYDHGCGSNTDLEKTNASLSSLHQNRIEDDCSDNQNDDEDVESSPNRDVDDIDQQTCVDQSSSSSSSSSSWRSVCFSCYPSLFNIFITLASSLYLFPNVWPLAWNDYNSSIVTDLLTGVFQGGDCIGRALPVVLPTISCRATTIVSIIRFFIIIPVFIITSPKIASQYAWASSLLHPWIEASIILLLAISNGIISSMSCIHVTQSVQSPIAKSRASSLGLVSLLAGVAIGSSLSAFNPLASP